MAKAKKRAAGRYMTQIYLGRDDEGRKKYKSIYAKSLNELKEKETALRMRLSRGLDLLSRSDSFAMWAADWLRVKESKRRTEGITERQRDNYRHAAEIWKEEIAGYEIGDVRADDIERVLLQVAAGGHAKRTVEIHRSAIRQIMKRAVSRHVVSMNPAEQIEIHALGREKEQRRALTDKEQNWIWETPHRAQPVTVIVMLSGLRRGELEALT